jgi:hypothetical protein
MSAGILNQHKINGMLSKGLKQFGMTRLKGFFALKIQGISTFTTISN